MATSSKTNGTTNNQPISTDELAAQIELLKNDIAGLTDTIGELGKAKISQAKKKAEDMAETGCEHVMETQIRAEDFIRQQPATAIGIAAGLGLLVGLFTARR